jgi:hypothetical protein
MITVVTSCINPETNLNEPKSFLSLKEREDQTLYSLKKIKDVGLSRIILVDNSQSYDFSSIENAISELEIIHLKQYQFKNKGLNELLMLLAIVEELPDDEPIFKISGRYYPDENFTLNFEDDMDFKIKAYDFESKRGTISTRGYFVRNKKIYKEFLLKTLNEVFIYPQRIVGFRSLINQIKGIYNPNFSASLATSIEFAAARVIKNEQYTYTMTPIFGIEGKIAGFAELTFIKE